MPEFTETGFQKIKIPEDVFLEILDARDEALAARNVRVEEMAVGLSISSKFILFPVISIFCR